MELPELISAKLRVIRHLAAGLLPLALCVAITYLAADRGLANDESLPGITGTVKRHDHFPSKFVAPRNVDVWLPPSYNEASDQRHPVIYMHDGQNLFDPQSSFLGVDWGVDEAMTSLAEAGKVEEAIVVGVWNSPARALEYLPAKMIHSQSAEGQAALVAELAKLGVNLHENELLSDQYLKFLVQELKPFVDQHYRTKPDRARTFIMGSSAGALISLYAISEYPEVFGGAGCVSTHWPIGDGLMIKYIRSHLPDPATHKLYFDFGTETLDKDYAPYQKRMDAVLEAAGYKRNDNWITQKFPGADHSERSWRKRVHVPLEFFLAK